MQRNPSTRTEKRSPFILNESEKIKHKKKHKGIQKMKGKQNKAETKHNVDEIFKPE